MVEWSEEHKKIACHEVKLALVIVCFKRCPSLETRMTHSSVFRLALVVCLSACLVVSQGHADDEVSCRKHQHHAVKVQLFGETLCPDTTRFVRSVLAPLFSNGVSSIMHLRYHAYGKARPTPEGLQCQHGEKECIGNRYVNCAQELHRRNQSDWFAYALCVQGRLAEEIEAAASGVCAQERGWDKEELVQCAQGQLGDELEHAAGEATLPLKLTFIPHVLVNNLAINPDLEHLGKFVCDAYTGKDRPEACSRLDSVA